MTVVKGSSYLPCDAQLPSCPFVSNEGSEGTGLESLPHPTWSILTVHLEGQFFFFKKKHNEIHTTQVSLHILGTSHPPDSP